LHILHNAIKHGISFLDVPVESVVTLIYDRFSISAARIESLKEFTEFVHLECLPAIGRLLVMFDAVFAYFVSMEKEDCPRQTAKMLGATFNGTPEDNGNEVRIYLNFASYFSENLQTAILKMEKHGFSWVEIHSVMVDLRDRLVDKLRNEMYGTKTLHLLENLEDPTKRRKIMKNFYTFFSKGMHRRICVFSGCVNTR